MNGLLVKAERIGLMGKSFEFKEEEKKELWIQIGNSGEETNNHFEILKHF